MNISSISSSPVTSIYAPGGVGGAAATSAADPTAQASPAARPQVSKMGQLMGQLQSLEKTDPAKAKQVLTQIASALQAKADSTGDSHLAALAGKFNQAAQTGDLSGLQPKGAGGHHHHAAPPGGSGGGGDGDGDADDGGSRGAAPSGVASKLASYARSGSDPRAEIASIIETALSGASSSSGTASTAAAA